MTARRDVLYDVFNGDADGICALHQLRLDTPAEARLITGVKRDVELLSRIPCGAGAGIVALDISLDANADALRRLLDDGARVDYYDHHSADRAFAHPGLRLWHDGSPEVCTSILVDRQLGGRHRPWAVVAAFGDNLEQTGRAMALEMGLGEHAIGELSQLGQTLNYNAYGERTEDLHIAPEDLYREVSGYRNPFDFIAASAVYRELREGYREDCDRLHALQPYLERPGGAIYLLPATAWSRRVSGVLANRLAARRDGASFAVLNERGDGSYLVSVRSGAPSLRSACGLCQQFDSGGGRVAAAGINSLPRQELASFMKRFCEYFELKGNWNDKLPQHS